MKKTPVIFQETLREADLLLISRKREPDKFVKLFFGLIRAQLALLIKFRLPATALLWLAENTDLNGFCRKTIAEYCRENDCSRPTGQDHFHKMQELEWIAVWPDQNRHNHFLVNPKLIWKGSPKARRAALKQFNWLIKQIRLNSGAEMPATQSCDDNQGNTLPTHENTVYGLLNESGGNYESK